MGFDVEGARKAGYSATEIADYLAGQNRFDSAAARKAGYSDDEIIAHLSGSSAEPGTLSQTGTAVLGSWGQGSGDVVRSTGEVIQAPGAAVKSGLENLDATFKRWRVPEGATEIPEGATEVERRVLERRRAEEMRLQQRADAATRLAQSASGEALRAREQARADGTFQGVVGGALEDVGRSAQDYYGQVIAEGAPMLGRQQRAVEEADGFIDTTAAMVKNPLAPVASVVRSGPAMAAGMAVGGVTGRVASATGAGTTAAREAAEEAFQKTLLKAPMANAPRLAREAAAEAAGATRAGAISGAAGGASALSEGFFSGAQNAAQVRDRLEQRDPATGQYVITDEMLATNSPRYRELIEAGETPDRARALLGAELGDRAALAGLWTVAANKLTGAATAEGKLITGARPTIGQTVANIGREGVEELAQGPVEDYAQVSAVREFNPSEQFDLGGSAAQNLVAGLGMGAAMHGGGHIASRVGQPAQPVVKLAGRDVTSYSDQELAAYKKSGVLTSAVQAKVDAELERRGISAGSAPGADAPGNVKPISREQQGDALDSAVQRFASDAGIASPAGARPAQPGAVAGRGDGAGGADQGPGTGGPGAVAASPVAGNAAPYAAADGVAQPQLPLGGGHVIPSPTTPGGVLQDAQRAAAAQPQADMEGAAQEPAAPGVVLQPNPLDNYAAASDVQRRAGVRFVAPDYAGSATSGVSDLESARAFNDAGLAAAQDALNRYAPVAQARGIALPRLNQLQDHELFRRASPLLDVLAEVTGRRPILFEDTDKESPDGFELGGATFINAGNLDQSLAFTAWHETFHVAETRARRGDVGSQRFVQTMGSIFEMIDPAFRRQYAERYLLRQEIASGQMTIEQALASPKLRSEMVADFLGRRGEDIRFWRHIAQRDPQGFGGFVRRWIDQLTNLIDRLRGKRAQYKAADGEFDAKDIDRHIKKLSHAKAVAASALIEWRKANPQLAATVPPAGSTLQPANAREADEMGELRFKAKQIDDPKTVLSPDTLAELEAFRREATEFAQSFVIADDERAMAEKALEPMLRAAEQAKPAYDRALDEIADLVDGEALKPPIKGMKRSAEKLIGDYRGDTSKMMDLVRGTILVESPSDVAATIQAIRDRFTVTRMKDRFSSPTDAGYRDVLINVALPGGLTGEIQVHLPEILSVKDLGHKVYEASESARRARNDERQRSLEALQQRIYGDAYEAALRRSSSSSGPGVRAASAAQSARNSASVQGSASAASRSGATGRLSGVNSQQEPSGSSAAGMVSKSKNLVPSGNAGSDSISFSKRQDEKSTAKKTDSLIMVAQRGERAVGTRASLSPEEKQAIAESAEKTGVSEREITSVVRGHKMAHPESQGWAPLKYLRTQFDDNGKIQYVYQPVPYGFASAPGKDGKPKVLKPGTPEYDKRVTALAKGMVDDVRRVFQRAQAGDKNAQNILAQAGWYKAMRARLRQEFGGLGDLFADLLGATSPNTPVRDNWSNAVDALRRASRGDFDALMPQWVEWVDRVDRMEAEARAWFNERVASGQTKAAIKDSDEYKAKMAALSEARKLGDDLLPTKETGKKYGFNGRNVVNAMVDLWRVVQDAEPDIKIGGTAPKALNFSGNLIGFRERATIDVWAARMLQRLSGGARIPSMAETGVSGAMRSDGTTTLQFGMGQDVFAEAARRIRTDRELKTDKTLASINDDDLQAVVWFIEKELWTVNNWTSAAGEGGSFELEASLTGSREQERIRALRKIIDSSLSTPAAKAKAREELASLERTVDRYVGGLSEQMAADIQGRDYVPTDSDMVRLANDVRTSIYELDDGTLVLASKAAATEGRYGNVERSLDLEFVSREGFNPSRVWEVMLRKAQAAKQDSTFLSRVLREDEAVDPLLHRPGVEIYFREAASRAKLEQMLAELSKEGVDFLTVIVDGRRSPTAMKGGMPPAVGVRLQYVPEFEQRYGIDNLAGLSDADLRAKIERKAQDLHDLAARIEQRVPGVSFARRFWYETQVAFSHEYEEKINALVAARDGQEGTAAAAGQRGFRGQRIAEGVASGDRQRRAPGRRDEGGQPDGRGPIAGDGDVGGDALRLSAKQRPDAAGGAGAGAVAPEAGRRGRVDLVGTHFSRQRRTSLDGRMFGTGYPGAELERLARATDPRLKERVYAYVDEGAGIRPESGVGAYAHRIDLRNLYDAGADPLRLGRADANAMESAILDAGFDGYYVPRIFNNQGVAVVMGPASRAIAVEPLEIGATSAGQNARQQAQAAPGSTIGRKEGSEYVLRPKDAQEGLAMAKARPAVAAEAPSLRMEFGEYRVGEAEREAANRALEAAGLSVRFSGKQGVDWVKFDRESGTLGIPRSRMPQVKMDDRAALVQFLRARGIDYEITEVDPAKLKPTQAEFSMSKVERAKNVTGDTATALISSDDYVLDGHHRWIAQIVKGEPLRAIRFDSRIGPLMEEVYRFPSTKTSDGSEDQPTISMAEFRERAGLDAVAFSGKQGERPPRAAAKLITPRNRADLETFAAAAFRDGRTEHELGMVLSPSSPHQALTMMGAGQQQPVTLMGNYAWHIKNNHPDITASDIASVPELLKRPRAIINYGGGKISVIVDRRDGEGRPMLVGLEKVQRGSRNEQRLTDMHTMFGWDDPVAEIIKAAQMKTAAVWLPSQEVSRVEGITAGDYLRRAGDLPASSPPSAPYTSGAAEPRGRNGRATSVSVLSDEALRKFASGDKGWANAKVTIAVDPKVDLTGVNFSRKQPPAPNAFRTEPLPEEGKGQAFRRVTQDQFIRMRQLREWALANGATLSAASDVYGAEERMHGRVANKVQDFRDKVVKPLIEKVEKAGFTMDQVEEVLHATHAEERNKQVAKINPQMPDGGSGMKTADARAILARTSPELKRIAAEFQQITTRARDILLQAGIISQDTADAWDAAYKHYVPLKGGDDEDAARRSGTGKGLSVNGKTKRALGHGERDEAIVENILRDYERAVTLAEKNRVGQAMMLWLTELADQRIGTVDQPKKRAVLMPNYAYDVRVSGMSVASFDTEAEADKFVRRAIAGGQPGAMRMRVVKVAADPSVQYRATPMLEENEAQVYVNGHAIRMQLNDPLLAQAYKRLDADRLGKLLQISREINTFLARAYTGYNPTFIIVNPIRDFGSGVVKMTGNFGAGTTAKVVARYPKALGTLLRHAYTGKSTPALDRYRASGGTTGAGWLGDIDRIGRDIQRDYENYQGAIEQVRRGKPMAAARVASSKLIGGLVGWIEKLNMATENAMRFAAFEQVLKETGSVEQAGSAAKNITLNFNRKGEMGSTLSALYLFFNPAIQDTASIVDMLSKGKHRYQAMALIGAMAGLAFAAAALQFGGDDEDYERWKRIPPNIRERNLIIRTGEDTYVKIPVPFGFGWFHGLGNAMFELQHDEPTARIAMGLTSSFLTHFSPIGNPLEGAETMSEVDPLQMLRLVPGVPGTGELGRAGISLLTNRNAFGSEVVPDSKFDEGRPDHMRMFRTTKGTAYDLAARKLSDLTGGTETQAGAIDVSPETLKFWVSTITGGTGTFLSDTAHLAGLGVRAVANPDDPNRAALKPEPREIPVGKAFYAQEGVTDSRRSFWEAANEAKDALQDFSRARKAGDIEGADRIRLERGEVMALGKAAAAYGKMVSKLRDRVEEINADETTSLAYKRAAIRQIEKEEAALYERFLQSVTAAREADRARQVNER